MNAWNRSKKTIFAVDDCAPFLEAYELILGSKYNLITFTRPSEVLDRMLEYKGRGESIDLLLTDQDMGTQHITGDELIRQAKEIMPTKYLIATSARKEDIEFILEILKDEEIEAHYFPKPRENSGIPIDGSALLEMVQGLVGE